MRYGPWSWSKSPHPAAQDEHLTVHHECRDEGTFLSRLVRNGVILPAPPGISLDFDAVHDGLPVEDEAGS